jgi:drug/metabolite transporter (DMT)-like permease
LIAMLVAAFGLAIAVILMKAIPTYTQMPPQHVAIWRFLFAAPPLWLYLLIKPQPGPKLPGQPWWFLILGVIFSIASFSGIFALQRLSSSVYVILINVYPSLVVMYALVTGASVPRLVWLGMPMTLVGVLLTSFAFDIALTVDPLGIGITVINALALAAYFVFSNRVFTARKEPLAGTAFVLTGGMLVGITLIPILGISTPSTLQGWALLAVFGLFGTLMPLLAMNLSLGLIGVARGSVVVTLHPVITILLAMIFLNERLTLQQWIGGGLVILAVILMQRSPDRVFQSVSDQARFDLVGANKQSTEERVK